MTVTLITAALQCGKNLCIDAVWPDPMSGTIVIGGETHKYITTSQHQIALTNAGGLARGYPIGTQATVGP